MESAHFPVIPPSCAERHATVVMFSHGDHPSKSKLFTHRTKKEIAVELQQTVNEKVSSQPFRRRACPFSYSYPDLASHLLGNEESTIDMVSILPCTLNRTLLVPSSQNTVQMLSFGRSEGQSNVCTQRYDLRFFWWIFSTFKRLLRRPRTAGPTIAHE